MAEAQRYAVWVSFPFCYEIMGGILVEIVVEVFGLLENMHIHCSWERVVGGGCIDSVLWFSIQDVC